MAAVEPEPERHGLLNNIKVMIETDKRSAEIIQTVVGYPEEFWAYIKKMDEKNPEDKCKDLIYSGAEYTALAREQKANWWIKQRRAKIICDFLMFWSRKPDTMINEIINPETDDLMPNAYNHIKEHIKELKDLHNNVNEGNISTISNKMAEIAGQVALSMRSAAFSAGKVCAAGAGKASDAASATIYTIDHVLGDLVNMEVNFDLLKAADAGKGFIDSIVGHHTDTVMLMLEGLVTVCAGTVAVQNYQVVFSTLLTLLGYLESGLRVGAAGSVLYAIGSVTNLLSKKLGKMAEDKKQELTTITDNLAQISTDIRDTTGENVTPENVTKLRTRLKGVINDASNALTTAEAPPAEGAMNVETTAEEEETLSPEEQRLRDIQEAQERETAQERERDANRTKNQPPPRGHDGGKKHKKSQKKPRKKASKSKRSNKAGKKTRKSRKKTRGKKH